MGMPGKLSRTARTCLLGGAAVIGMNSAVFAADLGGSSKDAPMADPHSDWKISVNGGLTTDYVFRGISQSDEGPAVFAGGDVAYKMFYVGVWASSVDDFVSDGNIEIDIYGGIKRSWNGVDLDVGIIYYSYPNNTFEADPEYLEIKAAISGKIWKDITATGTVFYSPDYNGEVGDTWTVEGKLAKTLPWWDLSLSGTLGTVINADEDINFDAAYGSDSYVYWNVGLSKTFRDHFTVDVRYWDSDVSEDAVTADLADSRVVGTLTFTY